MTEIMTSYPLLQNTFIIRRSRVANSVDIMKIATIFKAMFKDSNKVKRMRNYLLKCNL